MIDRSRTMYCFRFLAALSAVALGILASGMIGIYTSAAAEEKAPAQPAVPEVPALSAVASGDLLAPAAFREAVARVHPSLVTIVSLAGVTPGKTRGVSNPGEGPTTGLIVSPDGYIVTSTFNFIRDPRVITVILSNKSRHVARLLGRDEIRKLCLLKIDDVHDLPVPAYAPTDQLQVGQWAVSVGVGYGNAEPAVSAGIVSALKRAGGRAVQTDANISPANYGGPLLDIEGRVIGICVPLNPMSHGVAAGVEWYDSGIGFAIPLFGAEKLLTSLRDKSKVIQPAWLGIRPKPPEAAAGAVAPAGVELAAVEEKSPAGKGTLKAGDRILSIDGEKILDIVELKAVLDRHEAGDRISLQVQRGGSKLILAVELGVSPPPKTPPQ